MKCIPVVAIALFPLILAGCSDIGQQWVDPDRTFALFDQPKVKGINDTQEDLAKEAATNGDYLRAAQFYQQLVDSDKGTPEQKLRYKHGLADAARRIGNLQNAMAMFEVLFKENPNNTDIAEGRALTLMASGKTLDAGRAFSDIIDHDPKRWRSLNALGILFVTKNMIPEAMAYFTEALNQSPENAAVLNNVGLSMAIDRKFPRAIEALEQASRVSKQASQRQQIDLNLAMVYGVSGDLEAARDVASRYLEGPALDNNLGLYAHLAKDDALARSYFNSALSQSVTYYERAWENLDVVNQAGRTDAEQPGAKTSPKPNFGSSAKEPSAADAKKAKGIKTTKKPEVPATKETKEASDTAKPESATHEASSVKEVVPESATKPSPSASSEKPVIDKPAGLLVGPSE